MVQASAIAEKAKWCEADCPAHASEDAEENHKIVRKGEELMRKSCFVVAFVVPAALGLLWAQFSIAAQSPPFPVSVSFVQPANAVAPGECAFDVNVAFSGKAKTLTLPGGRFILTAPGFNVTLTNLSDSTKSVALNITGAVHQSTQGNGNLVSRVTGRNLVGDPVAGFVLSIGNFSIIFDANGNVIQPFRGDGQLISLCKLIS
jgi:hypothetical protein